MHGSVKPSCSSKSLGGALAWICERPPSQFQRILHGIRPTQATLWVFGSLLISPGKLLAARLKRRPATSTRALPPDVSNKGSSINQGVPFSKRDCHELYLLAKASKGTPREFAKHAQSLALKSHPSPALLDAIEDIMQKMWGPEAVLVLMGSAKNGTALVGGDCDYFIETHDKEVHTKEFEAFSRSLSEDECMDGAVTGPSASRLAIKIEMHGCPTIEIVPKVGDWNFRYVLLPEIRGSPDRIESDELLSSFYGRFPGAKNTALVVKRFMKGCHGMPSCYLEHLIRHIASKNELNSKTDPEGLRLFQIIMDELAGYPSCRYDAGIRTILAETKAAGAALHEEWKACLLRMAQRARVYRGFSEFYEETRDSCHWDSLSIFCRANFRGMEASFEQPQELSSVHAHPAMECESMTQASRHGQNSGRLQQASSGYESYTIWASEAEVDQDFVTAQSRSSGLDTSNGDGAPDLEAGASELGASLAAEGSVLGAHPDVSPQGALPSSEDLLHVLRQADKPLRPREVLILATECMQIGSQHVKSVKKRLYGMVGQGLISEMAGALFLAAPPAHSAASSQTPTAEAVLAVLLEASRPLRARELYLLANKKDPVQERMPAGVKKHVNQHLYQLSARGLVSVENGKWSIM